MRSKRGKRIIAGTNEGSIIFLNDYIFFKIILSLVFISDISFEREE